MTCSEVREYLFAFLDNELDAPLSIDLQLHLDGCGACAREAEIERTVRKGLVKSMDAAAPDIGSPEELLSVITNDDRARPEAKRFVHSKRWFRRPKTVAALAAVGLMVAGVALTLLKDFKASQDPDGLAELVVRDFDHFLNQGQIVQIASADGELVTDWLRKQTSLAVVLPLPGDGRGKLIGGRRCTIAGRPAAFAAYDLNGVPVSLVAMAAGGASLEGMTEVHHHGRKHWVDRCKGYTVVACQRDELVYAAVSRSGPKTLFDLMAGAVHESD